MEKHRTYNKEKETNNSKKILATLALVGFLSLSMPANTDAS